MFNQFCITDIKLSLAEKTITLIANFKIDEKTVDINSVKVKSMATGAIEDYTLSVDKKQIIIQFRDWPKQNYNYLVVASTEIKDKLDRPLESSLNKVVSFESQIKHKVQIIEPKKTETIKGNEVLIRVRTTPADKDIKSYFYQISNDKAFCNIIHEQVTDTEEIFFLIDKDGQYYLRARVQDRANPELIGEWSDIVDFVMIETNKDNTCDKEDTEEELSPFLEDMLSMDTVLMDELPLKIIGIEPNGKTGENMYIYFNQKIDLSTMPKNMLVIRRDL